MISFHKKSLKYVPCDLIIIVSVVAAFYLLERDVDVGNVDWLARNRQEHQELRKVKLETVKERQRRRDALLAHASFPTTLNGRAACAAIPDDYFDNPHVADSLRDVDRALLEIDAIERVLELERLGAPLTVGAGELGTAVSGATGALAQMALVERYLNKNWAHLKEFREKTAEFRALDVRLAERGGDLGAAYRERADAFGMLADESEDWERIVEEMRRELQSVEDQTNSTDEL